VDCHAKAFGAGDHLITARLADVAREDRVLGAFSGLRRERDVVSSGPGGAIASCKRGDGENQRLHALTLSGVPHLADAPERPRVDVVQVGNGGESTPETRRGSGVDSHPFSGVSQTPVIAAGCTSSAVAGVVQTAQIQCFQCLQVAPTGIDPVTFRLSVSLGCFRTVSMVVISR
jgi:hypothetical protein